MKKAFERLAIFAIGAAWGMGIALLDYDIKVDPEDREKF